MDIKEIKELKVFTEGNIMSMIEDFEQKTDTRVDYINISIISQDLQGKRRLLIDLSVTI